MTTQEKKTQWRVGVFMAIGLAAVATMVVYFGRVGDAVSSFYEVRVEYPDASGLLKGASVLLAGAKVGYVSTSPVILKDMDGVYVMLKIYDWVKIPNKAEFTIGSSGLLGDKFIQVNVKKDEKDSPPILPGATIPGKGETDIMESIKPTIAKINEMVDKVQNEVLNDSKLKEINATIANLKQTSESFAEASKKLDGIMVKTDGAINSGQQAMVSAKSAADELQKTLGDIRSLVQQTKQGKGALGVLLSDRQTAENLRALVANLRTKGILFYKDTQAPAPSR